MARKYQKEIEQILLESTGRGESSRVPSGWWATLRSLPIRKLGLALTSLLVLGFLIWTVSAGVFDLMFIGFVVLLAIVCVFFLTKPSPTAERKWRGRSIEEQRPISFLDRFRRWF